MTNLRRSNERRFDAARGLTANLLLKPSLRTEVRGAPLSEHIVSPVTRPLIAHGGSRVRNGNQGVWRQ